MAKQRKYTEESVKGISTTFWVGVVVIAIIIIGAGAYLAWGPPVEVPEKFREITLEKVSEWEAFLEVPDTKVDALGLPLIEPEELVLTEAQKDLLRGMEIKAIFMLSTEDVTEILNEVGINGVLADIGQPEIEVWSADSLDAQVAQASAAIARGDIDIAIIEPMDFTYPAAAFREMSDAGINQVYLWTAVEGIVGTAGFIGSAYDDGYGRGYISAEMLAYAIGGEGKVGIITFGLSMFTVDERVKGAHAAFAKYPGIEIVATGYYTDPSADTKAVALGMLTAHPDIDGIWVAWMDPPAYLVSEAAADLGMSDKIVITAPDLGGEEGARRVADPDDPIIGGVEADCTSMGRNAVLAALKYIAGDETAFNTFTAASSIVFAKANLEQAYEGAMGEPLPAYIKAMLT